MTSPDGAGLPVALLVSVLLMIGIAGVGVAAGPDVVSPDLDSRSAPEELTVPGEAPDEGEETANETYLREALGDAFEIEGEELIAQTSDGLPAELTAHASVSVIPAEASSFLCPPAGGPGACREVKLPDGTVVELVTTEAIHSAAGSNFGETVVRHLRPGGELVRVQLAVLGKPSDGSSPELEQEVREWLAKIESALIEAATDPRMTFNR